jgi:putative oxidoreductase
MKKQEIALKVLRVYLAINMIVHGVARIYAGGVAPFGGFLDGAGFPFGLYLAWAITVFEIAGGVMLISGYLVPLLALVFALELLMGIFLVHAPHGWFVVGLGRNGMEYSVLLIVAFICVAISGDGKNRSDRISAFRK